MFTLSINRLIGLALFTLGLGLILVPFRSASADWNDPAVQYGYAVTRNDPVTFPPANGNQRLELKTQADIERASVQTIHKDTVVNANYMCNWVYDKVLGRQVCDKDYLRAYQFTHPKPVPVCPFGYKLNYGGSDCVRILYPQNAHLNSRGDGWECNPGYHTNLTGTVCLSPEYVYKQCPGGSFSCGSSGCQNRPCSSCNTVAYQQPILTATPVIVSQTVIVNLSNPDRRDPPPASKLPSTGPSILLSLFGLSGWVARKLLRMS